MMMTYLRSILMVLMVVVTVVTGLYFAFKFDIKPITNFVNYSAKGVKGDPVKTNEEWEDLKERAKNGN